MALVPSITPLNGDVTYLRWKESMLLLLNTAGVAHVLSEDPPLPAGAGASPEAARKWARDDAVYRGHILASLSDAFEFRLDGGGGAPSFLEQLAHAEALGVDGQPSHRDLVDRTLGQKLPPEVVSRATVVLGDGSVSVCMDKAWEVARIRERNRISEEDELNVRAAMAEDEEKGLLCCNFGNNAGTGYGSRNSRA
ncbi:hypothetical protein PAHAL_6G200400 [Panicum hallii]|uniref:Uncharacterized protein n=1 Tax=Panicum hallii TaxID=206008 RepID=A0A2T8IGZ5_9POAL|nr:hypothetical protein PAHAL_6G200400 [Panicum hallii]